MSFCFEEWTNQLSFEFLMLNATNDRWIKTTLKKLNTSIKKPMATRRTPSPMAVRMRPVLTKAMTEKLSVPTVAIQPVTKHQSATKPTHLYAQAVNDAVGTSLKVCIIGIGNSGCKLIRQLLNIKKQLAPTVHLLAISSDKTILKEFNKRFYECQTILLGSETHGGLGSGGNAQQVEKWVEGCAQEILKGIDQARLVINLGGLGKGTGSGASIAIAKLCQQQHIKVINLMFYPDENLLSKPQMIQTNQYANLLYELADCTCFIKNSYFNFNQAHNTEEQVHKMANGFLIDNLRVILKLMSGNIGDLKPNNFLELIEKNNNFILVNKQFHITNNKHEYIRQFGELLTKVYWNANLIVNQAMVLIEQGINCQFTEWHKLILMKMIRENFRNPDVNFVIGHQKSLHAQTIINIILTNDFKSPKLAANLSQQQLQKLLPPHEVMPASTTIKPQAPRIMNKVVPPVNNVPVQPVFSRHVTPLPKVGPLITKVSPQTVVKTDQSQIAVGTKAVNPARIIEPSTPSLGIRKGLRRNSQIVRGEAGLLKRGQSLAKIATAMLKTRRLSGKNNKK